jgi:hypothetical protein
MSVVPQVTLEDYEGFLQKIGYLSIINVKGPFNGYGLNQAINRFGIRETAATVAIGDDAYNGAEWGKVSAIAADKITVQYSHSIKPAGIANADYNPIRTEVYPISLTDAVVGATQDNAYGKIASIGVVFVYPIDTNSPAVTNPAITLQSAAPTIQEGGAATALDFSIGTVSVQKTVNGVASGAPVISDAAGVVSIPNGNLTGELIRFVVSKVGYNTVTFGPYTVIAP